MTRRAAILTSRSQMGLDDHAARLRLTRATVGEALARLAERVLQMSDADFAPVEHTVRSHVSRLQQHLFPPEPSRE